MSNVVMVGGKKDFIVYDDEITSHNTTDYMNKYKWTGEVTYTPTKYVSWTASSYFPKET